MTVDVEISIRYDLGQYGWASFTIVAGEQSVEVGDFGDCTDALGDLVQAALLIATGASRAEARFDGEPNEWRLVVVDTGSRDPPVSAERPVTQRQVTVRVMAFADLMQYLPEEEGGVLFDALVGRGAFALAVQRAAHAVWDQYGSEGYDAAWLSTDGFPVRALKALDAALAGA